MASDLRVQQDPVVGELVQSLRGQIARMEGARRPACDARVSSGCSQLDAFLPDKGFRRGTLIEWLTVGEGSGAESLAFLAAREACREGGTLVVFDQAKQFYPPAAVRLGIDLAGMIVVQASSQADNLWALDQALRCPAVAAAVAWLEKLDGRTFRRLQLAVEQGGGLGLLVRPERARREPSWAETRLAVEPLPTAAPNAPRRLKVQVLRTRSGPSGAMAEVEIDYETHPLHLDFPLVISTTCRRAAGA
jgi:protein ImuA